MAKPKTPPAPARPYDQLIFSPRTFDLKTFEELGRAAKDAGFTHLYISNLRHRTDFRGEDRDSPWCEWSKVLPAIFKHVTPRGLEDAYPAAWVKREQDWLRRKHAICEKLGLRAAYHGCEPHWLSERVYARHPEWRGARCDNSLRTTGLFFAPDTDHPEVRAAYRWGVRELVRLCPLIDTFYLATNDSGAGFIWSQKLYVNPNGPTGREGRDIGQRVAAFLELLREGARKGGARDPRVFVDLWFAPEEKHLVSRGMTPGIGLSTVLPSDDPARVRECSLAGAGGWSLMGGVNMEPFLPEFPNPAGVLAAAAALRTGRVARYHAGGCSRTYFDAIKLAQSIPAPATPTDRVAAWRQLAAGLYAEPAADRVVAAWEALERAQTMAAAGSVDVFGGPVMLRWLIRPLVAHQDRLTAAERAYWIDGLYQSHASQPESWLDYTNVCGTPFPRHWEDASCIAIAVDQVEGALQEAAAHFEAAAAAADHREVSRRLRVERARALALRCCYLTVRHFGQMAALIRIRDAQAAQLAARGETMGSTRPELPDLPHGNTGSHGLFFMHRTMRWELDNTHDLIRILKGCPEPLIHTAPDAARAGALLLGPDLIPGLEKKARIMLKHWRDAEIGWYRPTLGG